jgi:hypothetical protein
LHFGRGWMDSMLGLWFRLRQAESLFAEELIFSAHLTFSCCSSLQHVTMDGSKSCLRKWAVWLNPSWWESSFRFLNSSYSWISYLK